MDFELLEEDSDVPLPPSFLCNDITSSRPNGVPSGDGDLVFISLRYLSQSFIGPEGPLFKHEDISSVNPTLAPIFLSTKPFLQGKVFSLISSGLARRS